MNSELLVLVVGEGQRLPGFGPDDAQQLLSELARTSVPAAASLQQALEALLAGAQQVAIDAAAARELAWALYALQLEQPLSPELNALRRQLFAYTRDRRHDERSEPAA